MYSDGKKCHSFVALLFTAGDFQKGKLKRGKLSAFTVCSFISSVFR